MSKIIMRREFLKMIAVTGGMMAISKYLTACAKIIETTSTPGLTLDNQVHEQKPASPTEPQPVNKEIEMIGTEISPSPTPVQSDNNGSAKVAFVKTANRAEGVVKSIDMLGYNPVLDKSVFVKPNFNSADPAPGSTHPDTLRTLIEKIRSLGAGDITLGDRSGMGNTRGVMEALGIFKLAEELGFDPIVFDEMGEGDWLMIDSTKNHWKQGIPFARPCLDADAIVQTCCLKTHQYGGHFTMSLKNSVGMVAKKVPGNSHNFMNELHLSQHQRAMIAEINQAYTPALVVLDGVEAFISKGPAKGKKVAPEVFLAGTDRVAIDAVGVALLRYHGCKTKAADGPIFEQDQIARAVELGLGVDSPEKIEFITGDPESATYAEEIMSILLMG